MLFFKKRLKKSTPEEDQQFRNMMQENGVGFKDGMAMIFSALLVIVLPCLLILCGIAALGLWLFGVL